MERERIDDLGINGYQIIQKEQGFCFGMDAVLLSDFAQVKNGGRVLDLGTGTGILPILMEAKTKAVHLTGLEIQPEMAEMAARSVKLNHLEAFFISILYAPFRFLPDLRLYRPA